MTFISPFIELAPKLVAQLADLVEISYDICFASASIPMVGFRYPNDGFDQIWEAAATAPSAIHRVENLCRHNQLPRILIEHLADRVFNLSQRDDIAGADEHFSQAVWSISMRIACALASRTLIPRKARRCEAPPENGTGIGRLMEWGQGPDIKNVMRRPHKTASGAPCQYKLEDLAHAFPDAAILPRPGLQRPASCPLR
jgi:hypothetical protein